MRIRSRMLALITPPVLGIMVIGVYSAIRAEQVLEAQMTQAASGMGDMMARDVDLLIQYTINEWEGFSSSRMVVDGLRESNLAYGAPGMDSKVKEIDAAWRAGEVDEGLLESVLGSELAEEMSQRVRAAGDLGAASYAEIFLTNRYGANVAQSDMTSDFDQSDESWWISAMEDGIWIGDEVIFDESAGVNSISIGLRVDDDNGEPLGVLKCLVSLSSLEAFVGSRLRIHEGAGAVGIVVFSHTGARVCTSFREGDWELRPESLEMKGFGADRFRSRGDVLGVLSHQEVGSVTGWRVLLLWDRDRFYAPAHALRDQILIGGIGFGVVAALVALISAHRMTDRIRSLADDAHACGRGELSGISIDEAHDEIGALSRSFANMTRSLKNSERRLKDEHSLLEAVISTVPFQVYWKDKDLKITGCNIAFARWVGAAGAEELVGTTGERVVDSDIYEQLMREDRDVLESGDVILHEERTVTGIDGHFATVHVSKIPMRDEHGAVYGIMGGFVDVTEQKKLESQLLQSQKLESIGQLAAGIAHEINTPAQYVGDNVRFMRDQFSAILRVLERSIESASPGGVPKGWAERYEEMCTILEDIDYEFLREEIPRSIEQSIEGIDRITHIVMAMKEFSHPGTTSVEYVDLNRAIRSTATVCSNRWKYIADIEFELEEALGDVPCLLSEFNQVILNLIVNAADAIESNKKEGDSKGRIVISTRRMEGGVQVEVRDTGGGIPEEIQGRIFDPFFTTKEVGKGTGQGLAISRDVIVQKHGGRLDLEVEDGVGTTFRIWLPAKAVAEKRAA